MKYIRLSLHFLRLSALRAMEYRAHFFTWLFVDVLWSIMDLIFFTTLINRIQTFGTWTLGETLFIVGLFRLLSVPVWGWMFPSFDETARAVSKGDLDLILTKPMDAQFAVSVRRFSMGLIASFVAGVSYMIYGARLTQIAFELGRFLSFFWLVCVSTALIYGIYFLTVTIVLFTERLDNIVHLFPSLFDASRAPKEIYPLALQRILTTILPIALILAVPSEALFGKANLQLIIMLHLTAIGFLIVSRVVWNQGLRRYVSASS